MAGNGVSKLGDANESRDLTSATTAKLFTVQIKLNMLPFAHRKAE